MFGRGLDDGLVGWDTQALGVCCILLSYLLLDHLGGGSGDSGIRSGLPLTSMLE